jgi:hypothetical protein
VPDKPFIAVNNLIKCFNVYFMTEQDQIKALAELDGRIDMKDKLARYIYLLFGTICCIWAAKFNVAQKWKEKYATKPPAKGDKP